MLDRRGFLTGMCSALAAVPLAGLANGHEGRKVVDGFKVGAVFNQEFKDLHFRTPIRTGWVQGCSFINCTYDDVILESLPGQDFRLVNCLFQFPPDHNGRGFIARG